MEINFEKFWSVVNEFVEDLQQTLPEHTDEFEKFMLQYDDISSENENNIVKTIMKPIKSYSKQILSHNDSMFENEVEWLGINFSKMWNEDGLSDYTKFFIWQYIEDIYILGNLYLNPNKRELFLQAVKRIKEKYPAPLPPMPVDFPAAVGDQPIQIEENQINDATEHLKTIFAGNDVLQDLVGDIAQNVGKALQNNNPQELMMSLMSGDHSAFGDLFQDMDKKYGDKLKDENIDENAILAKAGNLFQGAPQQQGQAAGMNPMAMMSMFNQMMPPQPQTGQPTQRGQRPQGNVHDVQNSPYFDVQQQQQAAAQQPKKSKKKTNKKK